MAYGRTGHPAMPSGYRSFAVSPGPPHASATGRRCTEESNLTGCIMDWYSNSNAEEQTRLQSAGYSARPMMGSDCIIIQSIHMKHCLKKVATIIKELQHLGHALYSLLALGRRCRSPKSHTTRFRNS